MGDVVDYKVWCFNGRPYFIFTCPNRSLANLQAVFNVFDLNWNRKDKWISEKYRNNVIVTKPHDLHKLLEYAQILSSGISLVRFDFYDITGNIYFGGMTFTSA